MLGHLAQVSWHIQLAYAFCSPLSAHYADVSAIVDKFNASMSEIVSDLKAVRPYIDDKSASCFFGDELALACVHLQLAQTRGRERGIQRWPVHPSNMIAMMTPIARILASIKHPVPSTKKEYEHRVRARSKGETKRILEATRRLFPSRAKKHRASVEAA